MRRHLSCEKRVLFEGIRYYSSAKVNYMTSSIVNRRDSAKSNGGHSVAVVEVLSVVLQISFAILLSRNYL
jgi:hypothetical protein